MRILCLSDEYPWPARDGYRQRIDQLVGVLTEIAEVDLFCAVRPGAGTGTDPPRPLARVHATVAPDLRRGPRLALRTVVDAAPRRIGWREWEGAQRALVDWLRPPYDLIWCTHTDAYAGLLDAPAVAAALRGPDPAPRVVVDFVDLEDRALRSRRTTTPLSGSPAGVVRTLARLGIDRVDEVRWRRLQRRVALGSSALVCSEADRSHLAAPAAVVPNGYPDPGPPPPRLPAEPVLLMVGLFVYPPNQAAARWFVTEVLPGVRRPVPGVQLRLVGRHDGLLDGLSGQPGVTVVGEVDDVTGELARARAVVVPVRSGSGTRIKVLEAFAHGVPVVSTRIGCEGIEAEAGRHLLVADDPAAFASACVRLLGDDDLALGLRGEARALYAARYRWSEIRPRVVEVVGTPVR